MKVPASVIEGVSEALERREANIRGGRSFAVMPRSGERLKAVRVDQLKMTQQEFALQFGIPVRTLQKWEQGVREPEGPTRTYLAVIERIPEQVILALRADALERVVEL